MSAALRPLDGAARTRVLQVLGWHRACRDLFAHPQTGGEAALATIRRLTARALGGDPTGDPAFDGLGLMAARCGISAVHTGEALARFALDAAGWRPTDARELLAWCYHADGALGVMMALAMGVAPEDTDTLNRAGDLGVARRLGSLARGIGRGEDAALRHLPASWLADPAKVLAARVQALAASYAQSGRAGAARLPFRCRWAVLAMQGGAMAGLWHALRAPPLRVAQVPWPRGDLARAVMRF